MKSDVMARSGIASHAPHQVEILGTYSGVPCASAHGRCPTVQACGRAGTFSHSAMANDLVVEVLRMRRSEPDPFNAVHFVQGTKVGEVDVLVKSLPYAFTFCPRSMTSLYP